MTCQVIDIGTPKYRVECHLKCQNHWKPINGTTETTCFPEWGRKRDQSYERKLTNFTIDYLECQRND